MNIITYITPEAQLFILDEFIKQNKEAISSLRQTKYRYHFFSRFYRLRPVIDEKECDRLATLAAHLHIHFKIAKTEIMMLFAKDLLLDKIYKHFEDAGLLKSILDTATSLYVAIDEAGCETPITLQ